MFLVLLSGLCLLSGLSGCGKQDQISSTVVKREKIEMLAAITRKEKSVWFFKVTAPQKSLEDVRSQIDDFFRTIRWDTKDATKPSWDLPQGWQKEPASQFRETTLTFKYKDRGLKFEVAITRLTFAESSWDSYLLLNVNRWRKQLLLQKWTQEKLTKESKSIESGDDKILLFDFVGYQRKQQTLPRAAPRAPTLNTPAGWEKLPPTPFSVASFQIREGDKAAKVTLTPLAPSGILANVNRWRGQIYLPHWTQKELDENVQEIPVGSLKAMYVALYGKDANGKPECILGGILVKGGQAWFFKLKGDQELGKKQESNFKNFIGSIKF